MKATEIRRSFIDFFRERGHVEVPSAPVVPRDDPTLMFTNAGMNQFKPFFLGQATPENRRVVDTQKCIRVSGKHNDLEDVGYDTYHHTLFEMLGNWSFGDYYKREAISWAWDLLTRKWGLPRDRLYATVFGGEGDLPADDEAASLWAEATDIDPTHIKRFGKKDNFWMMGDTGPCGPCSEIHIDLTPDGSGGDLVNAGVPQAMELWNLVFIQYNAEPDGGLSNLPAKHVDTGAGFERLCAVMECTDGGRDFTRPISNYDTDVFRPLITRLQEMSGKTYTPGLSTDPTSVAVRVCVDHVRTVAFAIADGVIPSNEGRGYVIRRLLRRAARYGRNLGLTDPFLYKLVQILADAMGEQFPELRRERDKIEKIMNAEENAFGQTLERGLSLFEEAAAELREGQDFPGDVAFKLYDTYGFPLDLTQVLARERGFGVDTEDFERNMEAQRKRARAAQQKVVVLAEAETLDLPETHFVGYNDLEAQGVVKAVLGREGDFQVVLDTSPFYAEMGGQVGDTGILEGVEPVKIVDTQAREGVILHRAPAGQRRPEPGEVVKARVDVPRRLRVQRHHTATHLLHWALREVLGKDVRQQGSLVEEGRLRFDFTHFEQVKPDDLRAIERLIQDRILENAGVSWFEIPIEKKPDEVIAFFGDTYGQHVRVIKIGGEGAGQISEPAYDGFSMELCGGTHLKHTGELGLFRFLSEGAIAAGVRRVEAVVGDVALQSVQRDLDVLHGLSTRLAVSPAELEKRVEGLMDSVKRLERELGTEKARAAAAGVDELAAAARDVSGVPVIVRDLGPRDAAYLRSVADALRDRFKGVAVLAGTADNKVSLLVSVDKGLLGQGYHAGKLIGELAKRVGGGGGGRPDLAQAGGRDVSALPGALEAVPELLKR